MDPSVMVPFLIFVFSSGVGMFVYHLDEQLYLACGVFMVLFSCLYGAALGIKHRIDRPRQENQESPLEEAVNAAIKKIPRPPGPGKGIRGDEG